jgi:hypothetical protein
LYTLKQSSHVTLVMRTRYVTKTLHMTIRKGKLQKIGRFARKNSPKEMSLVLRV